MLYFLFLISVVIIISEQGFHLIDLAWLFLFTSIVFILWFLKMKATGNRSLSPFEGINRTAAVLLAVFGIAAALIMLYFGFS